MPALTQRQLRRRQALAAPLTSIDNPVVRRVLAQRGLAPLECELELHCLLPWHDLKDIQTAAACVIEALRGDQRILIVGDYDADGATGVALAVSALRQFGAANVDYLVPDRVRYGYGLSAQLAELVLARKPELVVTVDNGISSVQGIARLKSQGITVVVTDHHLPGESLPPADAIVNPNQAGDSFASKALAGVGVMFYLLLAVRHGLNQAGHFAPGKAPNMARHLDLLALGTVADLVPLDYNNRILVEQGLRRMRAGQARPGIQALIEVAGRKAAELHAGDLGFALGPRINAAGRLEHMDRGIACLLATSAAEAGLLAQELDQINQGRRAMQSEMQDMAIDQVVAGAGETDAAALCVRDERWHEGIVGLIASQLKERFHRPALAFARAADGSLKGSGRSIAGFHLRDALALLDARQPGLIHKFGGHAMAAGLSLGADDFEHFAQVFVDLCESTIAPELLRPDWASDGPLTEADVTVDTVLALRSAGPWGQGWEEPVFDNDFEVLDQRIVGGGHLKLRLRLGQGGAAIDAIAFGVDQELSAASVHLVYQLALNDYHRPPRPQLIVRGAVVA